MSAPSVPVRQLYIAGEWISPVKGGTLPVVSPTSEEIVGYIPSATREDVDLAITKSVLFAKSGHWTKVIMATSIDFMPL